MSRLKKRLLLVGALLAVGGAVVGIGFAAIPGPGGCDPGLLPEVQRLVARNRNEPDCRGQSVLDQRTGLELEPGQDRSVRRAPREGRGFESLHPLSVSSRFRGGATGIVPRSCPERLLMPRVADPQRVVVRGTRSSQSRRRERRGSPFGVIRNAQPGSMRETPAGDRPFEQSPHHRVGNRRSRGSGAASRASCVFRGIQVERRPPISVQQRVTSP